VIKKITEEYKDQFSTEVLSGGMIINKEKQPIAVMAPYIQKAYTTVEERTGIQFGKDFLWHIFNPELSDWYMDSEKAAIALCVFKEYYPERQVEFAGDLQYALNFEGRDLCDDEAYRHLLEKYSIQPEAFYPKLKSEEYKDKATYEFALCKQLQVTGYPCVLLQTAESKFYLLSRGFTDYDTLKGRIENILKEIK
jgi:putative protein-disulfide isomerase